MIDKYKEKRNFKDTPEPEEGGSTGNGTLRFVVQRHDASHLHYDFRLEMEGVLKSWAVPKGPSLDPHDKRLAMMVEDHPFSYRSFEGIIPKGNYGAGIVEIWDEGTYTAENETGKKKGEKLLLDELEKGDIKFELHGKKLKGSWALVKTHGMGENAWLLIKHNDQYAMEGYNSEDHVSPRFTDKKKADRKKKAQPKTIMRTEPEIPENATKAPMPKSISPMLATSIDKPFDDKKWIFELKWDGYRALAQIKNGEANLYSRNGIPFLQFDIVSKALENNKLDAILDGEIVAVDDEGIPRFQYLQQYKSDTSKTLQYHVFDMVYYNGYDLKSVPLIKRKELLQQALGWNDTIIYSDQVSGEGIEFFKEVKQLGLEGIVAKLADSVYLPGKRSKDWLKIKTGKRQEAIICGYTEPKGSRQYFGSLILGVYEGGGKLKWIGSSGGGFDEESLEDIYAKLQVIRQEASPFSTKTAIKSKIYWVKPLLVCEIAFGEWTHDGMMRHPVFLGLRQDKSAKEVKKEEELSATKTVKEAEKPSSTKKKTMNSSKTKNPDENTVTIDGIPLTLSHLNKIFWPDDGITKGDLIDYYRTMHSYILPHLKNRAESQDRFPNGITGMNFFKKNMEAAPEWAETIPIESGSRGETVHYLICNNEATLVYMANLACIEMHPWNSKIGSLDNPDWVVIDIDPSEHNSFDQVIETALVVKSVLDKAKAIGFPKTSGATGIHIYIPMGAKYSYEEGKTFAHVIAELTQAQLPDTTTTVRNIKQRGDKIYIDYLQNNKGQTLASVYSVRPKPCATVSTPLLWEEVKQGLLPSDFTIKNVPARVKKRGDLFKGVLGKGIDIEKCLKLLGE